MKASSRRLLVCAIAAISLLMTPAVGEDGGRGAEEPFDIYMVVWRGETDVERGFQTYLRERGIRANVIIRNLERDRSRIPVFVEEIRELQPDLVHTWGTSTGLGIFGAIANTESDKFIEDVPGLFSLVAYPIEAGLVDSLEDPGRSLSGTAYLPPLRSQIEAILAYTPVERFGMIYNPLERNSLINVEEMRAVSEEMGFDLVQLEIPLDGDGRADPEALPGLVQELSFRDVDFLYIGPDSFVSIHSKVVTEEALGYGIPSFAGTEFGFEQSRALLGLVSRYFLVGKLAGLQAERVLLEGVALEDLPVASLSRYSLLLRMPVAHQLGLYPPINLLPLAEVVE